MTKPILAISGNATFSCAPTKEKSSNREPFPRFKYIPLKASIDNIYKVIGKRGIFRKPTRTDQPKRKTSKNIVPSMTQTQMGMRQLIVDIWKINSRSWLGVDTSLSGCCRKLLDMKRVSKECDPLNPNCQARTESVQMQRRGTFAKHKADL